MRGKVRLQLLLPFLAGGVADPAEDAREESSNATKIQIDCLLPTAALIIIETKAESA